MTFCLPEKNPAILLILSGPAGCGKTTLCERLIASHPEVKRAVTCTTRQPRPGEIDGEHYHFLTDKNFTESVEREEFLENAVVHGFQYGTRKSEVLDQLAIGFSVILNIDVQGAATMRTQAGADPLLQGRMISVFVLPPNPDVLRERMLLRAADTASVIEKRIHNAEEEMKQWPHYDYCIRSGSKDDDFRQFQSILIAERRRVSRLLAHKQS